MVTYVVRRLLLMIPMAIGMVVVTFGLLLIIPGIRPRYCWGRKRRRIHRQPRAGAWPRPSLVRAALATTSPRSAARRYGTLDLPERASG